MVRKHERTIKLSRFSMIFSLLLQLFWIFLSIGFHASPASFLIWKRETWQRAKAKEVEFSHFYKFNGLGLGCRCCFIDIKGIDRFQHLHWTSFDCWFHPQGRIRSHKLRIATAVWEARFHFISPLSQIQTLRGQHWLCNSGAWPSDLPKLLMRYLRAPLPGCT